MADNTATELPLWEDQVRELLHGTTPETFAHENYYSTSRSRMFAGKDDEHRPDLIRNPSAPLCVEHALQQEKGSYLTNTGALSVRSGAKTGRSPKDKRIVDEPSTTDDVWWGPVNMKLSERSFMTNRERALDFLNTRDQVFVVDAFAGWSKEHRIKVRILCARAYHALFIQNMLVLPTPEELKDFGQPDFTIINAGQFPANKYVDGMTSACSVDLNFGRAEMVILGTQYAGEMKKGILTLMMYLMPKQGHLCLHSSANRNPKTGAVCMFFGLSGTGKTTLSADVDMDLIGDDEHVWTDKGVFNIEGGCYAKCIGLSQKQEPVIFGAVRFGAVVENIVMDDLTREVDFDDISVTANTRCAYPLEYVTNAAIPATVETHPSNVVLLTCDGFGVLPIVSKLSSEQVIYHFLMGYTSKMAGTEVGVSKPTATFSSCYGEPFLVWEPIKYARMLAEKLKEHGAAAWLVNTGWVGGGVADGGSRCSLKVTRAIVSAIHSGELLKQEFERDPVFHLDVPKTCPGVDPTLLHPEQSWQSKPDFHKAQRELALKFRAKFDASYKAMVDETIIAQNPVVVDAEE
eukprot:m.14761 g.14761  ORF g.14761 m.14761 type:complete len:574 (-) comp4890_c0_seq1:1103-2824(-)